MTLNLPIKAFVLHVTHVLGRLIIGTSGEFLQF